MSDFLNDVKQFSPEEMEQFKAQIESDESAASVFDNQLNKMTAQERSELEGLMTGQDTSADVPEAQEVMASRKEVEDTGHYDGSVTDKLHGMAQGAVSQLPFGEKILAAGEAAYDVVTGGSDNLQQAYADNMVENLEQTKEFSEEHAYLDMGARAVSEMGQLWTGSALVKGGLKAAGLASKAAKAGTAIKAMPIVGKLAPKYGSQAVLEGVLQTARDLDMDGKVTLEKGLKTMGGNLALAATFGKLGDVAEGALKGVAGRIARTPAGEHLSRMRHNLVKSVSTFTLDDSLAKINLFVTDSKNTLNPHIKLRGETEYFDLIEEAYNKSGKLKDIVDAYGRKNIPEAMNVAKGAHEFVANSRDIALNKIRNLGKTPESIISDRDAMNLVDFLNDSIKYDSLNDTAKELVSPIQDKISQLSLGTGADLYDFVNASNFSKLPGSIKGEIDKLVKMDSSMKGGIDKFLMQARKVAYDKMESAALVAHKSGDDTALASFNDFVKFNKMNRVLDHNLNYVVSDSQKKLLIGELERSALSSAVHKTVNDMRKEISMLGFAGAIAGGAQYATGVPVFPAVAGIYLAPKLAKHFRNAPQSVAKLGNKVLAGMAAEGDSVAKELSRFSKVSDYLEKTSGIPLVQNAVVSFLNASRDIPEHERFNKLYSTAKAASHFVSSPLERSTESVLKNKSAVADLLRGSAPQLLEQFEEAVSSGEDIGPVMEAVFKMPEAAPFIKDGIGFDGKVYNEEDKMALEKELLNNIFVTGDYKVQMIKALRRDGTIPQVDQAPKRQPRRFEKRDKRRPY